MKASGTKNTCKSNLVRNSLKVFLRIPKSFSTTKCPHLWMKARKKEPSSMWTIFKNYFLKI
jgi:hypothetical protein